jgi:hypothetical protein
MDLDHHNHQRDRVTSPKQLRYVLLAHQDYLPMLLSQPASALDVLGYLGLAELYARKTGYSLHLLVMTLKSATISQNRYVIFFQKLILI